MQKTSSKRDSATGRAAEFEYLTDRGAFISITREGLSVEDAERQENRRTMAALFFGFTVGGMGLLIAACSVVNLVVR